MLHYWYSKGRGVYQPLGMVHIKEPLLVMERAFTHGAMCHRIDSSYPLSYFLFQPVIHDWCNKDPLTKDLAFGSVRWTFVNDAGNVLSDSITDRVKVYIKRF